MKKLLIISATYLSSMGGFAGTHCPAPDLTAARALFLTHCQACHGPNGDGRGPAAAAFPDDKKPRNFIRDDFKQGRGIAEVVKTIKNGIPNSFMAGFASFSDAQVCQLAHYVRSLREVGSSTPPSSGGTPPSPGRGNPSD